MRLSILGMGTVLPPHLIRQEEAAQLAQAFCTVNGQAGLLPALYRRTHVDRRGSVLLERANGSGLTQLFFPPSAGEDDLGPTTGDRMQRYATEAPALALASAKRALEDARLTPAQIAHLVTVSCTGFTAPGFDVALIKRLGLASTVSRTHIGFMGCHGALNGLRVASSLLSADPAAQVLLCAVELCSLHFHYGSDPEKVVANALFADGAAALVASVAPAEGFEAWSLASSGSCLFPDSEDAMTWRIGDHGFEMALSARAPGLIAAYLRPWLERWLKIHGLTLPEIRSWAIHPGGPRILSTVAECLGLPQKATAASRQILSQCGNMSSPTILFILEELRRSCSPRPCVAIGFGPGLAVETALFV